MKRHVRLTNIRVSAVFLLSFSLITLALSISIPAQAARQEVDVHKVKSDMELVAWQDHQPSPGIDTGNDAVSVQNGRITLTDERSLQIWTVNPEGSCRMGPWSAYFAAWSPDGTQLAATERVSFSLSDIIVMDADGTNLVNLTYSVSPDDYDHSPDWSPDGEHIVFVSLRDGNAELYVMKSDGSEQTQLTDSSADEYSPAWSPDGKHIVFQSFVSESVDIFVLDITSSAPPINLTNTPNEHDRAPEWSPDGQFITFSSQDHVSDGKSDIYVMDADGGNRLNLTNTPAENEEYSIWSPDGTLIAYRVDGADAGFYTMKPDGSDKQFVMDIRLGVQFSSMVLDDWQPVLEQKTAIEVANTVLGAQHDLWQYVMTGERSFQLGPNQCSLFEDVDPGAYHIQVESVPHYDQSVTCNNGAAGGTEVSFEIDDGERVMCAFVSGRRPELRIFTQFYPSPTDLEWDFTGTGAIGQFTLSESQRSALFEDLQPGEYTVTVLLPEGYGADVHCTDSSTGLGSVTLDLIAGLDVECTFSIRHLADLTIEKVVVGNPPAAAWQFSGDLGDFTLPAAGGAITFPDIPAGNQLSIIEKAVEGYYPETDCFETETGNEVYGVTGFGSITIVPYGVDITCQFTNNSQEGTNLTIEKIVVGGIPDSDWEFIRLGTGIYDLLFNLPAAGGSITFESLPPGRYGIGERNSAGYIATGICSDGSTYGIEGFRIQLALGEAITCTLTNTKMAEVIIVKEVRGNVPKARWKFNGGDYIGDFELPARGGSWSFQLPAGNYSFSESSVAGYVPSVAVYQR